MMPSMEMSAKHHTLEVAPCSLSPHCAQAAAMRSSTRTKTVNASTNAKKDALAELTAARTAKEKRTQDQQQCV